MNHTKQSPCSLMQRFHRCSKQLWNCSSGRRSVDKLLKNDFRIEFSFVQVFCYDGMVKDFEMSEVLTFAPLLAGLRPKTAALSLQHRSYATLTVIQILEFVPRTSSPFATCGNCYISEAVYYLHTELNIRPQLCVICISMSVSLFHYAWLTEARILVHGLLVRP